MGVILKFDKVVWKGRRMLRVVQLFWEISAYIGLCLVKQGQVGNEQKAIEGEQESYSV